MEGLGNFAWFYGALALATGFGIAVAAFAGAGGLGRGLQSTVEAIARQPEAAGAIRGIALIGLALIEALTIYTLLIAFLLWLRIPAITQIGELVKGASGG